MVRPDELESWVQTLRRLRRLVGREQRDDQPRIELREQIGLTIYDEAWPRLQYVDVELRHRVASELAQRVKGQTVVFDEGIGRIQRAPVLREPPSGARLGNRRFESERGCAGDVYAKFPGLSDEAWI